MITDHEVKVPSIYFLQFSYCHEIPEGTPGATRQTKCVGHTAVVVILYPQDLGVTFIDTGKAVGADWMGRVLLLQLFLLLLWRLSVLTA